eukprot:TRINITY_DN94538_c0_g1_i1.p2 TRINITY_DN94538_c0_g1~~TRINITY_DN94538_c0_g1_i1.p2  ORF type:complete len:108 (-),score=10.34 TRINITY_DN94538_c0_g1_i1:185-508(-)
MTQHHCPRYKTRQEGGPVLGRKQAIGKEGAEHVLNDRPDKEKASQYSSELLKKKIYVSRVLHRGCTRHVRRFRGFAAVRSSSFVHILGLHGNALAVFISPVEPRPVG